MALKIYRNHKRPQNFEYSTIFALGTTTIISYKSKRTTSYTDNLVLGSSVDTESRLRMANNDRARNFSLLNKVQIVSVEHAASNSRGTAVFIPGREVNHTRLVPKSRMSGAIPLHLLCAFMAWIGRTLCF
jgi:hypothetical protein